MLPIAMLGGLLFHDFINAIAFLAPYLIFVMLLVTFCKVKPSEFRVTGLSWGLLAVQIVGGVAVYLALLPLGPELAQGVFICVFCPTATAAPVVTGMLGGSISRVATYSIVSNLTVAALAPPLFSWMGASGADYLVMLRGVCSAVAPLLIAPLACAIVLGKVAPKVHHAMATHQGLSFYIWAVSLFIVVGRAVSYMIAHHERVGLMIALAVGAGVVCVLQFWIGRKIGTRYGDKIAGAQGLGQKNTVLAIWMTLTYLSPVASVAPAAYVAWQNTINSAQLYYHQRRNLARDKQQCVGSKQK
ncbi:MAG: transporter [Bacteroidales bacterium]|nr:transporter [Bacteroidales bacterium]